jgi:monomethylamine corrinoid protein
VESETHQNLAQAVIDGCLEEAKALAQEAVEQGHDAYACITKGLVKGIQHVAKLHASGEVSLPELLNSSDAMEAALIVFEPALNGSKKREVIALVVLETMDDSADDGSKIQVGTMLTDDEPVDDSQEIPFLHWLT